MCYELYQIFNFGKRELSGNEKPMKLHNKIDREDNLQIVFKAEYGPLGGEKN